MDILKSFDRISGLSFSLIALGIFGFMATPARAGLNVPYNPDQYTLHLWHFDEPTGTNFFDCATNQTQAPQITLTGIPGPTNAYTVYPNTVPTELALGQQPAAFPGLGYSETNGEYCCCFSPFIVLDTTSGMEITGLTATATAANISDIYTNLSYFISTNTGAFTIEALICPSFNPTAPPANGEIVCGDSGEADRAWQFRIKNTGQLEANININVSGSPTPVHDVFGTIPSTGPDAGQANTWYHVAVTFSGTSPTNGQPANQVTLYWTKLDPTRTNCDSILVTNIGTGLGGFPVVAVGGNERGDPYNTSTTTDGEGFQGKVDEARISDVCRASNQMAFNSTIPDVTPYFTQPLPAATIVGYGQTLTINSDASGTAPLQIQWQENGTNLVGQTNAILVISNVTFAANGTYQCFATNNTATYGVQGTNSTVDVVTVGAAPEGLFSTGVDPNGNPLDLTEPGSADLHYALVQSADSKNSGPNAIIWAGTNLPNTYGEGIGSAWIGPENDAGTAQGNYEYQTTFLIDQADPDTMVVSGNVKAGGAAAFATCEIFVNGQETNITLASNPAENPVNFTLTNGFQAGTNVIDFEYDGAIASAMGLEVGISSAIGNALTNAPIITNQPTSLTNTYDSPAMFSVVALGEPPLVYQWYQNGVPLNPANYPGANSRLLTLSTANGDQPPPGTNSYQVVVSNYVGSATSAIATLTVNAFPVVSGLPLTYTNLFTLYAGASPQFSVSVSQAPPPFAYFWFTNGVLDNADTANILQMTNVQAGTFSNYCIVTNIYGAGTSVVWNAQVIADSAAPYPQSVLALNPIGYWRLNEPDDNLNDGNPGAVCHDYMGGNDGIYTNVLLGQPGYNPATDPSDTSAYFGDDPTGSGDYGDEDANSIAGINFGSPSGTSVAFTVEAWVNGYAQTYDAGMVTLGWGGGGEQFDLDCGADTAPTSHGFRFLIRDASGNTHGVSSTVEPLFGNWYHLVGVVDEISNQKVTFYINGQSVGTASVASGSGVLSSTYLMSIGARMGSETSNFNFQFEGDMNDVAIFNYALSAPQVENEYIAGGGTNAPYFAPPLPTSGGAAANSTLAIPVTALGSPPLGYWWTNVTTGAGIASGTTNNAGGDVALGYPNVPLNWNGDQLQLTVTNVWGTTNVLFTLTITNGINTNPTNIVFGVTNNQLYLNWPADHTGWQLQAQTNNLSVGIGTNWVNVTGSTGTNQAIIPINLTNGGVFYRLIYP